MTRCFLGLGSNVEPDFYLPAGLNALRLAFGEIAVSPVYRSPAFGFSGADFMNLVVSVDSELSPPALSRQLRGIEMAHGRPPQAIKFADRRLDIDLLLCGLTVCEQPQLPREDILKHDFVLGPLSDLAPELRHPLTGRTMAAHWQEHLFRHGSQLREAMLNSRASLYADLAD